MLCSTQPTKQQSHRCSDTKLYTNVLWEHWCQFIDLRFVKTAIQNKQFLHIHPILYTVHFNKKYIINICYALLLTFFFCQKNLIFFLCILCETVFKKIDDIHIHIYIYINYGKLTLGQYNMPKSKTAKRLKVNKKTTRRKGNKRQQRKNEEDCILIEPYIEVVELVDNHSKELVKPTKEQSELVKTKKEQIDVTKPTPQQKASSSESLKSSSSSSKHVERRRSLRLLSMKANK